MSLAPHTPEAIQAFIRTLSDAEVRAALEGDPLGAGMLNVPAEATDLRWFLFDTFQARPAYFRARLEHVAAVREQGAAQLEILPLADCRPSPRLYGFIGELLREALR